MEANNFGRRLAKALARDLAGRLRESFPGVLPDDPGKFPVSHLRTTRRPHRLDICYGSPDLGLGIGALIKAVGPGRKRRGAWSRRWQRIDEGLRATAQEYHARQPWSILIAVLLMAADTCYDAGRKPQNASSFANAVRLFRDRAGRRGPGDEPDLFEAMFIGLYHAESEHRVRVCYFDVRSPPPQTGRPRDSLRLSTSALARQCRDLYLERNDPVWHWSDPASRPS